MLEEIQFELFEYEHGTYADVIYLYDRCKSKCNP